MQEMKSMGKQQMMLRWLIFPKKQKRKLVLRNSMYEVLFLYSLILIIMITKNMTSSSELSFFLWKWLPAEKILLKWRRRWLQV